MIISFIVGRDRLLVCLNLSYQIGQSKICNDNEIKYSLRNLVYIEKKQTLNSFH